MNYEQLAAELEKSPDYRVLRRLPPILPFKDGVLGKQFNGLYVDVEATGLDTDKDEIIELAAVPFKFTASGILIDHDTPLHCYNEPRQPISDEIVGLTGVTNGLVKGHKLDVDLLEQVISETDLMVAHNARYDRKMIERYLPAAAKKCWGCSMEEVPWPKRGKRLEYIVQDMGYFYDAHNAIDDCLAGLFALRQAVGDKSYALDYILSAARATTWHVWTVRLRYDEMVNDLLKDREYKFNNGSNGRPKAWHRAIPEEAKESEMLWLQTNAYGNKPCTARFDRITAFDRYSKRE